MTNNINNLTFGQLRTELHNSKTNPIKEKAIRNLMYIRYNQYTINKNKQQNKLIKKQQEPNILFSENDFASEDNNNNNDQTPPPTPYERDQTNNNIMSRLDSEIGIRQNKKNSFQKSFMSPFSSDSGNYAMVEDIERLKIQSFNNPN
jgi:hypothetical protein